MKLKKIIRRYALFCCLSALFAGAVLYQTRYTDQGTPIITTNRMMTVITQGRMLKVWLRTMDKECIIADPNFPRLNIGARVMMEQESYQAFTGLVISIREMEAARVLDPYWQQPMLAVLQLERTLNFYHRDIQMYNAGGFTALSALMSSLREKAQAANQIAVVDQFIDSEMAKLKIMTVPN